MVVFPKGSAPPVYGEEKITDSSGNVYMRISISTLSGKQSWTFFVYNLVMLSATILMNVIAFGLCAYMCVLHRREKVEIETPSNDLEVVGRVLSPRGSMPTLFNQYV